MSLGQAKSGLGQDEVLKPIEDAFRAVEASVGVLEISLAGLMSRLSNVTLVDTTDAPGKDCVERKNCSNMTLRLLGLNEKIRDLDRLISENDQVLEL